MGMFDDIIKKEQDKNTQKSLEKQEMRTKKEIEEERKKNYVKKLSPFINKAISEYPVAMKKICAPRHCFIQKKSRFSADEVTGWPIYSFSVDSGWGNGIGQRTYFFSERGDLYDLDNTTLRYVKGDYYKEGVPISRNDVIDEIGSLMLKVYETGDSYEREKNYDSIYTISVPFEPEIVNMRHSMVDEDYEQAVLYLFSYYISRANDRKNYSVSWSNRKQ